MHRCYTIIRKGQEVKEMTEERWLEELQMEFEWIAQGYEVE